MLSVERYTEVGWRVLASELREMAISKNNKEVLQRGRLVETVVNWEVCELFCEEQEHWRRKRTCISSAT